ncbi:hypothetical protein B0H67DRAFT_594239 [Lasiosphaeris hirsuta]|uniref:Uncharacterized protein n=1 Tax=Lasiosphaeris hirsuta TaxID=260670 RepID=A0AA40DJJ9_9PEZI|nr:hypothetical protein B0H67DRAFT_594239 [Lasiosphaeris hirsuta]
MKMDKVQRSPGYSTYQWCSVVWIHFYGVSWLFFNLRAPVTRLYIRALSCIMRILICFAALLPILSVAEKLSESQPTCDRLGRHHVPCGEMQVLPPRSVSKLWSSRQRPSAPAFFRSSPSPPT